MFWSAAVTPVPELPAVMLVAQPTWGVDVGASQLIRQALIGLRNAGVAVLVISEDLDELFAICDRLAVLARGYVLVTDPAGHPVVSAASVKPNARLRLRFGDGEVDAVAQGAGGGKPRAKAAQARLDL